MHAYGSYRCLVKQTWFARAKEISDWENMPIWKVEEAQGQVYESTDLQLYTDWLIMNIYKLNLVSHSFNLNKIPLSHTLKGHPATATATAMQLNRIQVVNSICHIQRVASQARPGQRELPQRPEGGSSRQPDDSQESWERPRSQLP